MRCTGEGLKWSYREHCLCSLTEVGGQLEASLPNVTEPLHLHERGSLEAFVDLALARFVEVTGGGDDGDDGSLEQVELIPVERRPLLSASELEAFQS